jgi:RNA 2',3'-cyclic 3'-phosphodiesterase
MTNETSSGSPASSRLFVAVVLEKWLKDALQASLPAYAHEAVRFVPRQNLHLTLHFIGNVPTSQVPALQESLRHIAAGFAPFRLRLQEVSPGPSPGHPRLIWARFAPNEAFETLSRALAEAVGQSRNQPQHPIPHVTLARFRKDQPKPPRLPVLQDWQVPEMEVNSFALWQSHLGQPHPQYEVLKTFPLDG